MALVAESKTPLAPSLSQTHTRLNSVSVGLPPLFDSPSISPVIGADPPVSFTISPPTPAAAAAAAAATAATSISDPAPPASTVGTRCPSSDDHGPRPLSSGQSIETGARIADESSVPVSSHSTIPSRPDFPIRPTISGVRKKSVIAPPPPPLPPAAPAAASSVLLTPSLYPSPFHRRVNMSPDTPPASSSGAEKRRNKLGYHRTSVACGHCRRRKIRCVVAPSEVTGRCTNCIKLRKECIFHPVDQTPTDTRGRHHPVTLVDRMGLGSLAPSGVNPSSVPSQSYPADANSQLRYISGMDHNTSVPGYSISSGCSYGVMGSATLPSQYSSHPDPTSWNPSLLSTPSLDASSTASSWNQSKSVSPQFNSSSPVSNGQYPPHTGYIPPSSHRAYPLASPSQLSSQYMPYSYDSSYQPQYRVGGSSRPLSSSSSFLPPPQGHHHGVSSRSQLPSDITSSSNSSSIPLSFSNNTIITGLGVQSENVSPGVGPFWDTLGNEVSEQSHAPVVPSQWYRSDISSSGKATSS